MSETNTDVSSKQINPKLNRNIGMLKKEQTKQKMTLFSSQNRPSKKKKKKRKKKRGKNKILGK